MPSVSIGRLRSELEVLNTPPLGAIATWRIHRQILDELERFAGVKTTADLTPTAIAGWIRGEKKSAANTLKLLSALRVGCNYAVLKGWLKVSPFAFRKLEVWIPDSADELDEPVQRHIPLNELVALMRMLQAESAKSWKHHRLFALALTTLLTGARAREIQCAKVADFDLTRRILFIRPNERRTLKTKRSRRPVPITSELKTALETWLPRAESEWAFPGVRRRGPWTNGSPGRRPLDCFKAACDRVGIANGTLLALRHAFITCSADMWDVPTLLTQRMVGHTQAETTRGYRGFDLANMLTAMDRVSLGLATPALT